MLYAGKGPGIEAFQPNRGPLKLSQNMIIENLAKVLDIAPETVDTIADADAGADAADSGNRWRPWTVEEAAKAVGEMSPF